MTVYVFLLIGMCALGVLTQSWLIAVGAWFVGCALILLVREQGAATRDVLRQAVNELRRIKRP